MHHPSYWTEQYKALSIEQETKLKEAYEAAYEAGYEAGWKDGVESVDNDSWDVDEEGIG